MAGVFIRQKAEKGKPSEEIKFQIKKLKIKKVGTLYAGFEIKKEERENDSLSTNEFDITEGEMPQFIQNFTNEENWKKNFLINWQSEVRNTSWLVKERVQNSDGITYYTYYEDINMQRIGPSQKWKEE